MTGFQRLCLVTCAVIFGLIVLGGVVRATDSGLGCPDWPRCHGSFIPKWERHTLIEYSHRLTASVAGLLVLSLAIWAWRAYRRVPAIVYPATAVLVLIGMQAWLGKETVERDLPPEIVAVHLTMALTILSLLAVITATAFDMQRPLRAVIVKPAFARVALLASTGTLALMIVGSYVSGAGYGLACSGWPLCNGDIVPTIDSTSVQLHFLHRFLALIVGVLLVTLAWLGWQLREAAPLAVRIAIAALALFGVQALVGAANIWTELADGVGALHLALATLLWLTLGVLNIRIQRVYAVLPRSSSATTRTGLAEAPR